MFKIPAHKQVSAINGQCIHPLELSEVTALSCAGELFYRVDSNGELFYRLGADGRVFYRSSAAGVGEAL